MNSIIEQILLDYKNGLTAKQCAIKYEKGERTIYRYLKQNDISTIKPIDKVVINSAIKDYKNNNLTATECAEKYGIGRTTLFKYIEKNNIEKNFTATVREYNRDYFESVDTEDKAYWLGFIAADGAITKHGYILEIGLQRRDKKHLIKFAEAIGGNEVFVSDRMGGCPFTGKTYPQSRISISSKKMCEDLEKYGVVERKSLILKFSSIVPKDLIRHYIRGYFDGDGCLTTRGREPNTGFQYYNVSIAGTKSFLETIMKHLYIIGINKITLRKSGNIFVWNKNGTNQISLFLDYLYKDCSIYLDRKYKRYLEFAVLRQTLQKSQDD